MKFERNGETVHPRASIPGLPLVGSFGFWRDEGDHPPSLEAEDIDEALRYAAFLADEETVELAR